MLANGADIKILDIYSRAPKAFALFSKDASLNSPESLKGKTIAGPMGTNLHELLVSYLKSKNLTTNDVNFVNMSIPDALVALSSGKIDVALLGGPTAYKAEKAGLHKITDGEGYIEALICVATTQKYYNEHRDVIYAFLKTQKEILEFMENKPEDTKQIVCKALKLDDAAYTTMFGQYDFNSKVSDKDIEGLQKTADFMFKNKMIKKPINAKDLLIK
ncbi:ABC transporter substrate-binding protein [Sneathia vaginalis]|uniref:ABC transporter substrate-binding protein n=1 Tax=Sneathia vaginalis TaxID=187101 RepID=UPI00370DA2C1